MGIENLLEPLRIVGNFLVPGLTEITVFCLDLSMPFQRYSK